MISPFELEKHIYYYIEGSRNNHRYIYRNNKDFKKRNIYERLARTGKFVFGSYLFLESVDLSCFRVYLEHSILRKNYKFIDYRVSDETVLLINPLDLTNIIYLDDKNITLEFPEKKIMITLRNGLVNYL